MNIQNIKDYLGNVNIFLTNEEMNPFDKRIITDGKKTIDVFEYARGYPNRVMYDKWLTEMETLSRFLLLYPEDRTSNAHISGFGDRFFSCLDFTNKTVFITTYSDTFLGQAIQQLNKKSNTVDIKIFWVYWKDNTLCFYLFTEKDIIELQKNYEDIWLNYQKYLIED